MMLLMAVQEEEWDEVDLAVRQFQNMTQAIKFSPKPVVVAPFGMTLGGGCEVTLHAAARQPHAELYCGLVEVGVGLLARRRRLQGDDPPRARQGLSHPAAWPRRERRTDGSHEAGVRDGRHGEGFHFGLRGAQSWIPFHRRQHHYESGACADRRQGAGAGAGARRLSGRQPAHRTFPRRARAFWRR